MKTAALLTVFAIFTLSSCVTHTNVTFESVPVGADVYVDGRKIGQTPITRRLGNGFWEDPSVEVEMDGYVPISGSVEKELKGWNLAFGILLWWPSLAWSWGPADEQFYSLRPMPVRQSDQTPETLEDNLPRNNRGEPTGTIAMQVDLAIQNLLTQGQRVRLSVVGSQDIEQADTNEGLSEYIDSAVANLLSDFGSHPRFTLVDRDSTAEILGELEFQLSGLVADDELTEYGELSGASHLLILNYSRKTQGSVVTITDRRRLVDIQSGSVLSSDTTQITLLWNQSSATYETMSTLHNGRAVSIVDGRLFPVE